MSPSSLPERSRPAAIRDMFDRIAPTYDLLNRLISLGLDRRWRRDAISRLAGGRALSGGAYLDIAAGSGDMSAGIARFGPRMVAGADFSVAMLRLYDAKLAHAAADGVACGSAACDAVDLPFRDGTFDGTVTAFGIRNFADRPRALREMHRVLRPGGICVILELTVPEGRLARGLYRFHARRVLPLAGRVISGDASAYTYLPGSIEEFPPARDFLSTMRSAGFEDASAEPRSFGAVTIFTGRKP